MSFALKLGINAQCTNAEYHSDKGFLSSSQLKLLNEDPAKFYKECVLGERVALTGSHLDEGSLVHSLVLEPENVQDEYAFYPGWTKRGKDYDEWLASDKYNGAKVISVPQYERCSKLANSILKHPFASELLAPGMSEHTCTAEILGVPVKSRYDRINADGGYISDIKTTGYESGHDIFKDTIQHWQYDLSAALYAEIAHANYGKLFDFYFVVVSKKDFQCEVYKTSSATLSKGAAKVNQALVRYIEASTEKYEVKLV